MESRTGIKWNREETILAFELYCNTPFGKIGKSNKNIIELAIKLGRTPSSVALKMQNLAHYDPSLIARGIAAMKNGSKLDKEIFEEFYSNIEELAYQAEIIRQDYAIMQQGTINAETLPVGKYKETMTKTRLGQYQFRIAVLNSYNNKCCITGLNMPELLIASHIKPWVVSDEKTERTNPSNGLCLNPLHDKAFDRGLITITKEHKIVVSEILTNSEMDIETNRWIKSYENKTIILPDRFLPNREFIEYHNDVVFKSKAI